MYQLLATAGGGKRALIPEDVTAEIDRVVAKGGNVAHFDGMKRRVEGVQPDDAP